jgi:hypothetical protein
VLAVCSERALLRVGGKPWTNFTQTHQTISIFGTVACLLRSMTPAAGLSRLCLLCLRPPFTQASADGLMDRWADVGCSAAPPGTGTINTLQITVAGVAGNVQNIVYAAPVIDSINPPNGPTSGALSLLPLNPRYGFLNSDPRVGFIPGNVPLTLFGANFGTALLDLGGNTNTVKIAGQPCVVTQRRDDRIVCTTPVGRYRTVHSVRASVCLVRLASTVVLLC